MKRPIVRASIVGIICIITYYIILVIRGMYLTYNYVPDMIHSYESVDYMQEQTVAGIVIDPLRMSLEVLGLFLFGMVSYFVIRKLGRKG